MATWYRSYHFSFFFLVFFFSLLYLFLLSFASEGLGTHRGQTARQWRDPHGVVHMFVTILPLQCNAMQCHAMPCHAMWDHMLVSQSVGFVTYSIESSRVLVQLEAVFDQAFHSLSCDQRIGWGQGTCPKDGLGQVRLVCQINLPEGGFAIDRYASSSRGFLSRAEPRQGALWLDSGQERHLLAI